MISTSRLDKPLVSNTVGASRSLPKSVDNPVRRRGRPTREEAAELHRALLQHALDHFLEKGFEGATLDAITGSVGMSKRTVYTWYDDKVSLFKAAFENAIDDWLEPLDQLPQLESDDLEQTLIDMSRLIVATLMKPQGQRLIRITNAESYRMPEVSAYAYHRGREPVANCLSDLFRRRIFANTPNPPDLKNLAMAFLNLLSGPARLNAWGLASGAEEDPEAFIRHRVGLFLHGVQPR